MKKGYYGSASVINVIDVRDGFVSLSIEGTKALMKEGETHELKGGQTDYNGTIEVVNVKENSAVIKADLERTTYYYIFHISLALLLSLLIALVGADTVSSALAHRK